MASFPIHEVVLNAFLAYTVFSAPRSSSILRSWFYFGEALRAARRPRLDLAGAHPDGQVGDVGALGLAATVARHDAPPGLLRHLDRIDRLADGPYLVHLEQQARALLLVDGPAVLLAVRHRQIVPDALERLAVLGCELRPVRPVVLVEGSSMATMG